MAFETEKQALKTLQEKMSAYNHASALLFYDGVTTAPGGTASNRGKTLGILSELSYRLATDEENIAMLETLDAHPEELTAEEKRQVYLLLKHVRDMRKVPMDEYVAYEELLCEADDVWHRAKENNDFPLFAPILEKIIETNRRFAGYFAPDMDPYDYWLGEYEKGLSKEKCDAFFAKVRARLVPLIRKVGEAKQIDNSWAMLSFPIEKQRRLSDYLMTLIGLDREHVGISETEHPFTTSLGSHFDTRITTHYFEDNFLSSLYSVVHEGGHALYDTGSPDEYAYTVLDGGVSMGIHESQSRFYENILGRSLAFCETIYPKLVELCPELASHNARDLYRVANRVEPSLIRVDADEVTYSLHIMVRYEIEKKLMDGSLAVKDLPRAWNELYKEYLGIDVPDDKRGCLQDSHWSGGSIGYFPSYALGSAYGAQFLRKMQETVDVDGCVRKGDFSPINRWNREQIWRFGNLKEPNEILGRVLGEEFDPDVYVDYLENKMRDVYGL